MEKSTGEFGRNFRMWRKQKIKIKLIYDLKLKYNDIGRNIRRKTQILTRDSAQINPINRQIKGFSFLEFEDYRWHPRINFSLFSQQIITIKHSSDVEMSLEAKGIKRFKDWDVLIVQLLKTRKNGLHHRRTCQFIGKIECGRWIWLFIFNQQLRWNAWMWIVAIKSRPLNRRWSAQISTRCVWRRIITWSYLSDQTSMFEISPRVHQSPYGAFNLSPYNSSDKRLRLKRLKMNHCPIRFRRVPLHLSEDRRSRFNTRIERSTFRHATCAQKTEKHNPTGWKLKGMREYIRSEWLSEIA